MLSFRNARTLYFAGRIRLSSTLVRLPDPSCPREVPTPLLFVSAKDWDADSHRGIDLLTTMFSSKGFTCVHCDLSSPESSTAHDSSLVIKHFMNGDQGSSSHYTTLTAITSDLKTSFRLSGHASFFPPVLYARSAASLIAQAYISSNPVSAMILSGTIPANNAQVSSRLLPTEFPEFNFEPKFPIALLTSKIHLEHLNQNSNRLSQDPNVSLLECEDLESSDAVSKMELWMDELGI